MKLVRFGNAYGGFTIDLDRVPKDGTVIDAGVGTDMSFAEGLHAVRSKLRFVLIDHTEESLRFVTKTRGYPWVEFVNAAIAPHGIKTLTMFKHKTRSGSESCSHGHKFADVSSPYSVPAVSLTDLIAAHRPCVVKLDIESAEYGTIRECIGVPQVCAEFHHRMDSCFTVADTEVVLADFRLAGYDVAHRTPEDEILMVKR